MQLDIHNPSHHRYFSLLKRIDQGEFAFMVEKAAQDADKIVLLEGITYPEQIGILTIMHDKNGLRVQSVLESGSLDEALADLITSRAKEVISAHPDLPVTFWIGNANQALARAFLHTFRPHTSLYRSHEFTFDYHHLRVESLDPIQSRRFQPEDLMLVLHFLEDTFKGIASQGEFITQPEHFLNLFQPTTKQEAILYFLEDELMGFFFHQQGDIAYFSIASNHQRRGYGQKILHHALSSIRSTLSRQPFLYCVDENKKAIAFYHKAGFDLTARALHFKQEKKG